MNVTLTANKGSGLSREAPGLVLQFTKRIEDDYNLDNEAERKTLSFHLETQGKRIANAMWVALPNATLEALVSELTRLRDAANWASEHRNTGRRG